MKNIVFIRMNPDATGGAERYLSRLGATLNKQDIKTSMRSYKGKQGLMSWLKALKFNSQVCLEKQENELYFSLERIKCADIYRAGDGVHKVYRKLKKFWIFNPLNFVYAYLEKRCFQNAKHIISNSNFIKKQIIETYAIDESKITTIYNGVNLPTKIKKGVAKVKICERYGLDYELATILFVGSGFRRKGLREFLEIISKLGIKCNSIVVGKDKNINSYKKLAKKLGLNTVFTGSLRVVNEFYEGADIFLFPTHYEPFSNVVLEAISYGCMAITTAQNGASEILEDSFVMENPSDDRIIYTIQKALEDSQYLSQIQNANIELSKNFTIEKNANATMEIINAYIH